jgi:hypothetical protein
MMPATIVPWPTQSPLAGPDWALANVLPTWTRLPNCELASTPLSITATLTPWPWLYCHALE